MSDEPLAADRLAGNASNSGAGQLASVAVLLCTRNGEQFLVEQMESLQRQTHKNVRVFVSDDGSSDTTLSILAQQQQCWEQHRLSVFHGPQTGFASNFLSISCRPEIQADLYAWCDQDDIWHDDKLQRAVDWLSSVPDATPALYCSRTELVDECGHPIGFSPLFSKAPSFKNALVQSIAGGNTMVFNHALMKLLREAGNSVQAASHDWWAYLIASGCGGEVFYDVSPSIYYRQHTSNCVGANTGIRENGKRIKQLLHGRYRGWMDQNLSALQAISHRFTQENKDALKQFALARKGGLFQRLCGMRKVGVYRQTFAGNLGFTAALLIRRV